MEHKTRILKTLLFEKLAKIDPLQVKISHPKIVKIWTYTPPDGPKLLSEIREVMADTPLKFGPDWEWLGIDIARFIKIWGQKKAIFAIFRDFFPKSAQNRVLKPLKKWEYVEI